MLHLKTLNEGQVEPTKQTNYLHNIQLRYYSNDPMDFL